MTVEEQEMVTRLRNAIYKLAGWDGVNISDLIEDELLKEDDLG